MKTFVLSAVFGLLVIPAAMAAGEHEAPVRDLVKKEISKWVQEPAIIEAVRAQNNTHASLSQNEIKLTRWTRNGGPRPPRRRGR